MQFLLGTEDADEEHIPHALFTELDEICLREGEDAEWKETARYTTAVGPMGYSWPDVPILLSWEFDRVYVWLQLFSPSCRYITIPPRMSKLNIKAYTVSFIYQIGGHILYNVNQIAHYSVWNWYFFFF